MNSRISGSDNARAVPATGRVRPLILAVCLVAALFESGCDITGPGEWVRNGFKVGPNYGRPPAPIADEWIQVSDPRTHGPTRDADWWEVFDDPILTSLVIRAYQHSPSLRTVGTRVLQARGQQAIAVGNFFPQSQQLLGAYDYGNFAGTPTHVNITAVNFSWELDFWGKFRRQVESANAKLDGSVEDYDDAIVTLLADTATNYVQYRIAQQRIKIAQDNLITQEELVVLAEQQLKVGTAVSVDVDQLRSLMMQTRSTIPALRITLGEANDRLCVLLGEPPHDLAAELGPGPELGARPMPRTPDRVGAGVPADLLRRRPDIRSAERQVAAQSAQIGVAEADLYPSISVGALLGTTDVNLGPALAATGPLAFITPQFNWNILNYGRLINNIHVQDAKTQELIASYQQKVLTAAQEVQTALRGFLLSQRQADDLDGSAAAAVSATKVQEKRFRELKADVNRLFTLENARLQAQDNAAVAQGNISLNLINVYRALGGGWELRLSKENCAGSMADEHRLEQAPPFIPPPKDPPGKEEKPR